MSHTDSVKVIWWNNDNLVEIIGLQSGVDGSYINSASVTLDLHLTEDDSLVSGANGISLNYVAASNGNYQGTIPDTASISRNEEYTAKITADGGAGLKGYWEVQVRSRVRYE